MRRLGWGLLLLGLTGCGIGDSDQAGSTTGPGVSIHCGAEAARHYATPVGDTTTVVRCPGVVP